ncbi:uncharacterized protein LOC110973793 [Acanthaster planci]|uniref:Uncharacterized protein LOC110973793 n=1 Tax=Acanthaster planci TaxID=133434 RepID=A0A8B7XKA3_ACAPL|nr:uncharacterized protein LOC110973793 [Acanthaster planci]
MSEEPEQNQVTLEITDAENQNAENNDAPVPPANNNDEPSENTSSPSKCESQKPISPKKLPRIVKVGLFLLGLYPVAKCPKCCRSEGASEDGKNGQEEDFWSEYGCCKKMWAFSPVFVLAGVVILHVLDFFVIIVMFMDKEENAVFVLWYFTYLLHLTTTLTFCLSRWLYLSLCYDQHRNRLSVWSKKYLKMHAGYGPHRPILYFFLFMTLPIACILLKVVTFAFESGQTNCHNDAFSVLRFIGGVFGYFYYGVFCFVISFFRIAHRKKFYEIAKKISERGKGNIEDTKHDIKELSLGFLSFRDFVGAWMMISLSLGVFGLASMVPFTLYTLPTIRNPKNSLVQVMHLEIWTAFTWLDKILFILWPTVAVAGLDAGYSWRYFKEMILMKWHAKYDSSVENEEEKSQRSKTLEDILVHIQQLSDGWAWAASTLILSVVSVYVTIQLFPKQDVDPWISVECDSDTSSNYTVNRFIFSRFL